MTTMIPTHPRPRQSIPYNQMSYVEDVPRYQRRQPLPLSRPTHHRPNVRKARTKSLEAVDPDDAQRYWAERKAQAENLLKASNEQEPTKMRAVSLPMNKLSEAIASVPEVHSQAMPIPYNQQQPRTRVHEQRHFSDSGVFRSIPVLQAPVARSPSAKYIAASLERSVRESKRYTQPQAIRRTKTIATSTTQPNEVLSARDPDSAKIQRHSTIQTKKSNAQNLKSASTPSLGVSTQQKVTTSQTVKSQPSTIARQPTIPTVKEIETILEPFNLRLKDRNVVGKPSAINKAIITAITEENDQLRRVIFSYPALRDRKIDFQGREVTALQAGIINKNKVLVRFLINLDPEKRDEQIKGGLDFAVQGGYKSMTKLLRGEACGTGVS